MAKRRTLGDGLTPEEEEFLRGSTKAAQTKAEPKKEKKPMAQAAAKHEYKQTALPPQYQKALVGLNTRLEQQNSDALLRASVERKIQHQSRAAMQDIVNQALSEWLKKMAISTERNGYLRTGARKSR